MRGLQKIHNYRHTTTVIHFTEFVIRRKFQVLLLCQLWSLLLRGTYNPPSRTRSAESYRNHVHRSFPTTICHIIATVLSLRNSHCIPQPKYHLQSMSSRRYTVLH